MDKSVYKSEKYDTYPLAIRLTAGISFLAGLITGLLLAGSMQS